MTYTKTFKKWETWHECIWTKEVISSSRCGCCKEYWRMKVFKDAFLKVHTKVEDYFESEYWDKRSKIRFRESARESKTTRDHELHLEPLKSEALIKRLVFAHNHMSEVNKMKDTNIRIYEVWRWHLTWIVVSQWCTRASIEKMQPWGNAALTRQTVD